MYYFHSVIKFFSTWILLHIALQDITVDGTLFLNNDPLSQLLKRKRTTRVRILKRINRRESYTSNNRRLFMFLLQQLWTPIFRHSVARSLHCGTAYKKFRLVWTLADIPSWKRCKSCGQCGYDYRYATLMASHVAVERTTCIGKYRLHFCFAGFL